MKRVRTLIVATCILFAPIIRAEAAIDTLLHIDDGTLRLLRYHIVANDFDNVVTVLQLGEIRIRSGSSLTHIALDVRTEGYDSVRDTSGTPVQSTLLPYLTSEQFIITDDADSLILFRQIGAKPSRRADGSLVSTWKFDDRSVFATVVKDAATHETLWVLDSVGIDASTLMDTLIPYIGNGTRSARVARAIPANVRNRTVYVQVIPYRYGASPLGMQYYSVHSPIAFSAMYNDGYNLVSPAAMEVLRDKQFRRYMALAEELYARHCVVPSYQGLYFTNERKDSIRRRFFEIDAIDTSYRVKPCDELKQQGHINGGSTTYNTPTVIRCYVSNGVVHLDLYGGSQDVPIVLEMTDEHDRSLETPWTGTVGTHDRLSVAIPMPSIRGTAYATIRTASGRRLSVVPLRFE